MKRITRSLSVIAALALGLTGLFGGSVGSVSAAAQPVLQAKAAGLSTSSTKAAVQPAPHTKAAWRADIKNVRQPGTGCYSASYPALTWHAITCAPAGKWPTSPARVSRPATYAPADVGNGTDSVANVTGGSITTATGTFSDVSSDITEQGQIDGTGSQVTNAFTLQLNTQPYIASADPDGCHGTSHPECQEWQQFIYDYDDGSGYPSILMQYWLLDYDASCPSDWLTSGTSCYVDSASSPILGGLPASGLGDIALTASAVSGGNDSVTLSSSATAYSAVGPDSKLDLAGNWTSSEWNVFGDDNYAEAEFGDKRRWSQ